MLKRSKNHKDDAKTIVFTGGHGGTAAYAVIEEIRSQKLNWEIHWIGPGKAIEGTKVATIEARYLSDFNISFHSLISGRLQKKVTRHTIPSLLKVPVGFIHAFKLLQSIKPDLVFSLGGFSSFPVVFVAWLRGVKVIVHDQTAIGLGLANRLSVPFSSKILLARKSVSKSFSGEKYEVVGNPVRKSILQVRPKLEISKTPTLFIFTGSRGSQTINSCLDTMLGKLLGQFTVIHLTGELDFDYFNKRKNGLVPNLKSKYEVYKVIPLERVADFYERSDIIIGRAGANTLSEIMIIKRPAIIIPLPVVHFSEQIVGAEFAKNFGIATVIDQETLNPKVLLTQITKLLSEWKSIVEKVADKKSPDIFAARKIVEIIKHNIA